MGNRIAQNVIIKSVKKFWNEEDGMGVVEIVLITVENQRHPNLMCFV